MFPTVTLTSGAYRYTAHSGVDLVRRSVRLVANSALPTSVQITALATANLRSLHDCPVYVPPGRDGTLAVLLQFRTADTVVAPPPEAPLPDETKVMEIFARACAGGCHLADAPTPPCLAEAAGHLSLCADEARSALVSVPAREYGGLLRVSPRDSAHSYLLRKLLGAPPARTSHPVAGELGEDELLTLERWIDAGVPGAVPPS